MHYAVKFKYAYLVAGNRKAPVVGAHDLGDGANRLLFCGGMFGGALKVA